MSTTYISAALRRTVLARAAGCCEYCRVAQTDIFFSFEIDHIIAEKHGGATTSDNLCLSCPDCNAHKGSDIASIDWTQGETLVLLFHPRRDKWDEHFVIEKSGRLKPLTATARVTVQILQINDPERIQDRKLFMEANSYPCNAGSP